MPQIHHYKPSELALKEVEKFIEYFGSIRKAATAINVSFQTIYNWRKRRHPIKKFYAEKIEKVTNGFCSINLLMRHDEQIQVFNSTLKDYVIETFLTAKSTLVDMSPEEYYNAYVPDVIKQVIEADSIVDIKDCQKIASFFGGSSELWFKILENFKD